MYEFYSGDDLKNNGGKKPLNKRKSDKPFMKSQNLIRPNTWAPTMQKRRTKILEGVDEVNIDNLFPEKSSKNISRKKTHLVHNRGRNHMEKLELASTHSQINRFKTSHWNRLDSGPKNKEG